MKSKLLFILSLLTLAGSVSAQWDNPESSTGENCIVGKSHSIVQKGALTSYEHWVSLENRCTARMRVRLEYEDGHGTGTETILEAGEKHDALLGISDNEHFEFEIKWKSY